MPGLMGTGHKDTPDVPAEALQLPELGGATRTPKAHLQPPCDAPRDPEAKAHRLPPQ